MESEIDALVNFYEVYSENYANTGKYDYNTNNTSIPKPKDLPPRPQQKDISQRTYPSQKPIADSDLQRGKNKPQYEGSTTH
jgi:hypothetical protein